MKIHLKIIAELFIIPAVLFFYTHSALCITGSEAFEKLKERLSASGSIKGDISISFQTGEIYTGEFQYMAPGKIHVNMVDPPGKKIISNGKRLWVYDASSDICGVQELYVEDEEKDKELDEEEKLKLEQKIKGGIENLFSNYEAVLISEGTGGCTIELRNEHRRYTEVLLKLDSTFLLTNARFADKDGVQFVIKLTNIRFDEKIFSGIFNFNVPANAQVVKNPLDIR